MGRIEGGRGGESGGDDTEAPCGEAFGINALCDRSERKTPQSVCMLSFGEGGVVLLRGGDDSRERPGLSAAPVSDPYLSTLISQGPC